MRFAVSSLRGKLGGTQCMRSHISVHLATTKYSSISFICKNKIEKEGLPSDSPAGLGAGGPEFKSRRPDQNISHVFFGLLKALFVQNSTVEFRQTGASRNLLNGRKLITRDLASMGKIQGTLCISGPINLRKCKSGDRTLDPAFAWHVC
jgi:hypothetical protein